MLKSFNYIALIVSLASCLPGRQHLSAHSDATANRLFQFSVIPALQRGVFDDPVYTIGALKQEGDFGLGTLNALDGEMLLLNDTAFQASADGRVQVIDDSAHTPFAVACRFQGDTSITIVVTSEQDFYSQLSRVLSPNYIYAIHCSGTFDTIAVRSVHRQSKPYATLARAAAEQAVFTLGQVTGELVSFFSPQYTTGINVPGFHSHFISANRQQGGHVLRFRKANLQVQIARMRSAEIAFPSAGAFPSANLFDIDPNDIHKAEK